MGRFVHLSFSSRRVLSISGGSWLCFNLDLGWLKKPYRGPICLVFEKSNRRSLCLTSSGIGFPVLRVTTSFVQTSCNTVPSRCDWWRTCFCNGGWVPNTVHRLWKNKLSLLKQTSPAPSDNGNQTLNRSKVWQKD